MSTGPLVGGLIYDRFDMRFAARESALFTHMEVGLGLMVATGGLQHLTRLMGRARALEVMLTANGYSADLAER